MKPSSRSTLDALFIEAYPFAVKASHARASAAVRTGAAQWVDYEDLKQEGILACWRALPRFDPARSCPRTFVEHVVRNRLATLQRERFRRPQFTSMAHCERRMSRNWEHNIEMSFDVRRVIGELADRDQRLALALREHTPTEAGRLVGIARSTVYERIRHIRQAFEEAGLRPQRGRI